MATITRDPAELRTALAGVEQKLTDLASSTEAISIDGDNVEVKTAAVTDLRSLMTQRDEIFTVLQAVEGSPSVKAYLAGVDNPGVAGADAAARLIAAGVDPSARSGVKGLSLGELVARSPQVKGWAQGDMSPGSSSGMFRVKSSNLGAMGGAYLIGGTPDESKWIVDGGDTEAKDLRGAMQAKDIFTASGGTYTSLGFGSVQNDGPVVPAYRLQRVRDLFPNDTTSANLIEYQRRTGYTNNARVVSERTAADGSAATGASTDVFGLKPASNLVWETVQAPVRLIAHTMKASKTVLDDEPRLASIINGEMLYGLRLTEDAEILYGDGTGTHLQGIMNVPGIQTYLGASGPAGDYKSDTVRRALTLVQLAYYESTGCVVHPFDWEQMELQKDNFGRYVLTTNVAIGAQQMLWRNPVTATPAMQEGDFLVGAFGLGAKLYDREQAGVAISTENADDFERNAITMRAEERLVLEVTRPESFVHGTFATA